MPNELSAQAFCNTLARRHYENFPTASYLLPRPLRAATAAIYAFARSADDFADEYDWDDSTRLAALAAYEQALRHIDTDSDPAGDPALFIALAAAIRRHRLPLAPFYALLSAFRQDIVKKRYEDFSALHDYCRRSANPVGRLMLALFDATQPAHCTNADAVCTALQLINFIQDIGADAARGRIYLPQDEMRTHGVSDADIFAQRFHAGVQALIATQIARAQELLEAGAPLGTQLPGRYGFYMRAIVHGGRLVLGKLERQNRTRFVGGARLQKWDWMRLLARSLSARGMQS